MGKLMRTVVVRNLREGLPRAEQAQREVAAPEINVCCHGQEAGDEVCRRMSDLRMHVPASVR